MTKVNHIIYTLAALLTLVSCTQDKLIITGETMVQLGDEFVVTANAMNAGFTNGTVTTDQYKAWMAFGKSFQLVYPQATRMWKIAKDTGNTDLEAQMIVIITNLATGLAAYALPQPDGGK